MFINVSSLNTHIMDLGIYMAPDTEKSKTTYKKLKQGLHSYIKPFNFFIFIHFWTQFRHPLLQ